MRIRIICPAPAGSRTGNRTTALRWARILRSLGHRVAIAGGYDGAPCDLLVALHARRSFDALCAFTRQHPERAAVVALTGTDVYGDIHRSRRAQHALRMATRLIALQPLALRELPADLRHKARVIYQSAVGTRRRSPRRNVFEVCVVGHLRPVKDPFRTALAVRRLPSGSSIRVLHAGKALGAGMAERARAEMRRNPRYRWLGECTGRQVRALIARSRLLVLTSRLEGGANVISEALRASVPVVTSNIPGSLGLLGAAYPGVFPVGDTAALSRLLRRAETDRAFYDRLRKHCRQRAARFRPARERQAWRRLLAELAGN